MKILLYVHFWAPNVGGVEVSSMALARGLATWHERHGGEAIDVSLATPTPADGMDDSRLPFRVIRRPGVQELARLIREADAIHVAGPCLLPLLIGKVLRKPMLIEHHGYQAGCPNGLLFYEPTKTACPGHFMAERYLECVRCNAFNLGTLRSVRLLLLTFLRRGISKTVAANTHISKHLLVRLELPRSQVIYYGIPDSLAGWTEPVSQQQYLPACFAYVGRLVQEKGPQVLIEAGARLKKQGAGFQLRFIGDGPERQRLEALADANGLHNHVVFTGFLSGEALRAALADVVALVMPSLMEETAGLAPMEQMMRGRIVCVSEIGGLSEVVGDAGLKFPPGDADALAACMLRVLEEPELRKELGWKARRRAVQFFLEERMVEEHLQTYRAIVASEAD